MLAGLQMTAWNDKLAGFPGDLAGTQAGDVLGELCCASQPVRSLEFFPTMLLRSPPLAGFLR
jgi:hypothetical protein